VARRLAGIRVEYQAELNEAGVSTSWERMAKVHQYLARRKAAVGGLVLLAFVEQRDAPVGAGSAVRLGALACTLRGYWPVRESGMAAQTGVRLSGKSG
jgi:hypothetical protein